VVLRKAVHGDRVFFTDHATVDVPGEKGRPGSTWVETPVGSLKNSLSCFFAGLGSWETNCEPCKGQGRLTSSYTILYIQ